MVETQPVSTLWAVSTVSATLASLEMESNASVIQTNATKITVAVEKTQFVTIPVVHSCAYV